MSDGIQYFVLDKRCLPRSLGGNRKGDTIKVEGCAHGSVRPHDSLEDALATKAIQENYCQHIDMGRGLEFVILQRPCSDLARIDHQYDPPRNVWRVVGEWEVMA